MPADASSNLNWTACPVGFYSLSTNNELVIPMLDPGQAVKIPVRPPCGFQLHGILPLSLDSLRPRPSTCMTSEPLMAHQVATDRK